MLCRGVLTAPKERRGLPRGQAELPKEDQTEERTEGGRTMSIYGGISNGNSDRNGHVRRPHNDAKSPTTAVQAFNTRPRAHKSHIYGGNPNGIFVRNGAVPVLLTLGDLPGFLTKGVKTWK